MVRTILTGRCVHAILAKNTAVLNDPAVFTRVCGGLSTGGTLDQTANQLGGFAGYSNARGFVDGTFAWTSRDHEYARNVCTIETQGLVSYNPATGVLSDSVHAVVDDIYAGTLSGLSQIDETSFSFRGGTDFGNERVSGGPRAVFTQRSWRRAPPLPKEAFQPGCRRASSRESYALETRVILVRLRAMPPLRERGTWSRWTGIWNRARREWPYRSHSKHSI